MGGMVKHGTMALTSDNGEELEYRPEQNPLFRDTNNVNQQTPNGSVQNGNQQYTLI